MRILTPNPPAGNLPSPACLLLNPTRPRPTPSRQAVLLRNKKNGTIVVVEIVPSAGGSMLFKTAWKRPSEKTDAFPPGHTPEAVLSPPHSYNQNIQQVLEKDSPLTQGKPEGVSLRRGVVN